MWDFRFILGGVFGHSKVMVKIEAAGGGNTNIGKKKTYGS